VTAVVPATRVPKAPVAPCPTPADLALLGQQAPGLVLSGIDIGPMLLVATPHSVVATGHHRNHAAMNRVIGTFAAAPAEAEPIVAAARADYLFVCPGQPEMENVARDFPAGLSAGLSAGRVPDWLEPVALPSGSAARLYRVRRGGS